MTVRNRPLSPHLQVYRWQIGNSLSILHRFTGLALGLGLAMLAYWLIALASGPQIYGATMRIFASWPGLLCLGAWTFSFLYHLLNGVRHLVWDAGYGFERTQRHVSGWLTIVGALLLTGWFCVIAWRGLHP